MQVCARVLSCTLPRLESAVTIDPFWLGPNLPVVPGEPLRKERDPCTVTPSWEEALENCVQNGSQAKSRMQDS